MIAFASGRRAKFLIIALWLVAFAAAGPVSGKLEDAEKNDPASFLPGKAESVQALKAVRAASGGEVTPAIVVYRRDSGLTAADRAKIGSAQRAIAEQIGKVKGLVRVSPRGGVHGAVVVRPSRDGTSALLIAGTRPHGKGKVLQKDVNLVRDIVHADRGGGLQVAVTGPAGFSRDAIDVFKDINGTLLFVTLGVVFLLLIVIYRSPIFWFIPLFSVVMAEVIARGTAYGLAQAGLTVNGQSGGILPVLVFGAGTDYALLLVSRYREELRQHEDKHAAMRRALRRAGPAIFASALTVVASLLCLTLAEVNGTAGLGPICAIGVALAALAMLTLLPALLLVAGRRAFWPFVPHVGDTGSDETHGAWRRVGERIVGRPGRVAGAAILILLVLASGLTQFNTKLTQGNQFRGEVESVQGQKLLDKAFPAGANAPLDIVVRDSARVAAVRAALAKQPDVAAVSAEVAPGPLGAHFNVTLKPDPYSQDAFDAIPQLRAVAHAAGGSGTLIGGPTAQERDLRVSAARDNRLIIPIVLFVVMVILALLLRAIVAPLVLIGTVILSFAAALGAGAFVSEHIFGFAGFDPSLPLFAFIFLVALGVDYNIFLMARVREETQRHGTRDGMLRGLAVTGGVITSAGIVLAATFSALAVLPLVFLTEIGFIIAFGVLLDTFLVRSVLVPALVFLLGDRVWWPSSLGRHPEPPEPPAAREPDPAPVSA